MAASVDDVSGISAKRDGGATALFRISQALQGLVTSLVSSVEEFQDVGAALELEVAAGIVSNSQPDHARPELLLAVAATVKEMVSTWVSDLKANSQVQKLLPATHLNGADLQDLMLSKPPPCSVAESAPVQCISSKDSRVPKRAPKRANSVQGQVICQHSCEHHPELVDRWLWRNLPQEMVELVFAHLPLPHIIELCKCSEAWSVLSKSSNFVDACSQRYPKLVGLSVWDVHSESMGTTVYDIKSREWLAVELGGLPRSHFFGDDESYDSFAIDMSPYRNVMCACNGGLVCFVPQERRASSACLVCNPLTNVWKSLPLNSKFANGKIIMVQLTMEDDTKGYKVILVSRNIYSTAFSAHFYSSQTGGWNSMDSGLVYGTGGRRAAGFGGDCFVPYVFDCATKVLHDLTECDSFKRPDVLTYSMPNDHLYVLHDVNYELVFSELIWDSSVSDVRALKVLDSKFRLSPDSDVEMLSASCGLVLLITDNCAIWHEDRDQGMEFHDLSANHQHIPPAMGKGNIFPGDDFNRLAMSELRWDICP